MDTTQTCPGRSAHIHRVSVLDTYPGRIWSPKEVSVLPKLGGWQKIEKGQKGRKKGKKNKENEKEEEEEGGERRREKEDLRLP